MKSTLIFDLNGVLIQSPYLSDRFHNTFGIEVPVFLEALKEVMSEVRQPNSRSIYSLFKPYLEEWNIELNEEAFLEFWFSAEKLNEEMYTLLKEISVSHKLVILSNNFKERTEYYFKTYPQLFELFSYVSFSWKTGHVKPSLTCYEDILEQLEENPKNCIYFDDSQKNVDLAQSLGIESYIFEGAEQVKRIVK